MLPAALAICIAGQALAQNAVPATYSVTFTGNWTDESTPNLPLPSTAHFTTRIGAIHNSNVTFWESGGTASTGVEIMAETGAPGILRSEIEASSHVHAVIQHDASIGGTGTVTFDIEVSEDHPLITLTSMIGPSPDWFVGVSGRSLLDSQGDWLRTVRINLYPYDAGTENGNTFSLSNPDTNPQETITSLRGQDPFTDEPMAWLSFVLDTTNQPPRRVTGVSIRPGVGALTVSWNPVDDADGYKVQWWSAGQTFGSDRERVVGSSVTQVTIPDLTPGTEYSVRIIATKPRTRDGKPSHVENGTPLAPSRKPLEPTESPPTLDLLADGDAATLDLAAMFTASEGETLTYEAESSDPELVTVSVEGTELVLVPNDIGEEGTVTVTVTATDEGYRTATLSFAITIEPNPRSLLRGWRKVLFER